MTHNVRHLRASDSRPFSRCVPKVRESSSRDRAIFQSNSTKAAVCKTHQGPHQYLTNRPYFHDSSRKHGDRDSVLTCPAPPFADPLTAQFAAQCPTGRAILADTNGGYLPPSGGPRPLIDRDGVRPGESAQNKTRAKESLYNCTN
jgi:hypothetical protein